MLDEMNNKNKWLIFLIVTNIISIILNFYLYFDKDEKDIYQNTTIIVQISGEVINPGMYELELGSRLNDLVLKAGGYTLEANPDSVNLALLLKDEMKVNIPKIIVNEPGGNVTCKVNINTSDLILLITLNGIGEVKAQAIISYREKYGPYHSTSEIKNVTGIGDKTYENIKDDICI